MKKITIIILAFFLILSNTGLSFPKEKILLANYEWSPYTGKHLPNGGFFTEIVREAFYRIGYEIVFEYYSWNRALNYSRLGKIDGIVCAYKTEKRTLFLSYPNPVITIKQYFITYGKHINKKFKNYSVGALFASAEAEKLYSLGYKPEPFYHDSEVIDALIINRIKVGLLPRETFDYFFKRNFSEYDYQKFEFHPSPIDDDVYVAFSKKRENYSVITMDFNRGLDIIKADGTYDRILKKHDIKR